MTALHYVEKCEHGTIVAQCRCPAPDKPVHVVACPRWCPENIDRRTLDKPGG